MESYEKVILVDPDYELVQDIINIRTNINTTNTFLDYGEDSEYKHEIDDVREEIANYKESKNKIWKIIQVKNENDGTIRSIGFVLFYLNRLQRRKHVAEFSIGIIKGEQGNRFGDAAIDEAIKLARATGEIKIIKLTVDTTNQKAISLYWRKGFVVCGCLKKSKYVKLDNGKFEYRDEFIMALEL
ncbi:MAG: GNAT family N-acetyltransferase [Candidatus Enteromonas sp.]